jgi:murein DD-endopeptidase MepM/ murein hydrolase activator NlpD
MRKTLLAIAAPLTAAACASTTPAPITYAGRMPTYAPPVPPAPPVAPVTTLSAFASTPYAQAAGQLHVCGGRGSNLGPVDNSGASMLYTPWIAANDVQLLRNPTESACLSSGFGYRSLTTGGATGGSRAHAGVDLANPNGGYIYAAASGRIVQAGPRGEFGNAIEIDHGNGVRTLYGHMREIDPALAPGMMVAAGAPIGRMGMTGNATGVHLHYEVSVNGVKVDPLKYGLPVEPPSSYSLASEPVS